MNINNQHSEKKHYGSLSHSLISSYLFLAVVPLIFVLWFSYQQAQKSLNESITAKLTQSSKLSRDFIENWFFYRFADLNSLTESRNNLILLNKLSDGFKKSNDSLKDYIDSFEWSNHVDSNKNALISFGRRYDYVKDLYLIDTNGNILYSMERKSDLGQNLFLGNLASSKFSKAVKMTLESGKDIFSDLEYYTLSGNEITGFITSEISNDAGESIGVLAVQLGFDGVFQHFSTVINIDYLHHYIIAKNGELRTPINENNINEIFKRKIQIEEYGHIEKDPDEENVTHEYLDPNNNRVIGLHKTISIKNIDWVLISEINYKKAFLSIDNLLKMQIVLVFFSISFIVVFAYYYSRRITQPIVMLAQASMDVAMGESNNKVNIKVDNEIGQLAESFNHMLYIRKEYERSLIENKVEIKHALENLKYQKFALDQHAIVSISNADGRIIYSNKRFNEISGYSNDELYGENHRLLKSQLHDDDFFIGMFYELVSGKTWHGEICNKAKDGKLYWIDVTIVPYMDVKGEPDSYISIATDITMQKQAALELVEAKTIAETAVLAKNGFLASMSHEIRTPLNGVIGMLGLMLNAPLSDEQRQRADIAQKSANSLLTVIDDILDFSKIEADKLELELLDFNLIKMMDDFLEPIALQAHEKNLEIILNVTQIKESMIKGDQGRIRQIISNLVSNAIKFTEKGEIVITVSSYEVGLNELKINILVSDTGVGISEDQIPTLFDSFSQVDASITRKYGGTGLGLTIVKKLCTLMGGTVSVSKNHDNGSVFNVSIIVEKSEHAKHVVPRTDISKLKILIVDDNTTNREVLRGQLEYWGANVFEAVSGVDAQRVCEQRMNHETSEFFNIAFIDMQMPEMNGVSLVESLKTDERYKNIKFILMTSIGAQKNISNLIDIGFSGYFSKPAKTSDIFDALSLVSEPVDEICPAKPLVTHEYIMSSTIELSNDKYSWPEDTKILLVEDNHVNQLVAKGILNKLGLHVDIVANGLEAITALELAQSDSYYSLILMDCQMPEMDGYEATRAIREGLAGEQFKEITIVAMTANAMQGDREKCLKSGMNDYFTKPIDTNLIVSILQNWLLSDDYILKSQS